MGRKDVLGRLGEDLAARYLESRDCAVLDRNWRCSSGELDIVARDADTLVVCEVKTRTSTAYGSPLEAVGPRKLRRLRALAVRWLEVNEVHAPAIRFDVIGIVIGASGVPTLTHVQGVQ